ncbi:hypothetical protein [Mobiluncus mulieris]|uniref:hypothetical protein n=1 Tax=Mobiluncus mulieris TaxID=2052 RepID=UPI00160F3B9E|nr:hypothetical protein [Mobiluncus mulieris]
METTSCIPVSKDDITIPGGYGVSHSACRLGGESLFASRGSGSYGLRYARCASGGANQPHV